MKKWLRKINRVISDNFFAEQFRLLATVPFLFALGIAIYFALPFEPSAWLSLSVFELWILLFYLCRYKKLHYLFIGGLIVMSGFLNIQAHSIYQAKNVEKISSQKITYLRGQIKDISLSEKGKLRLLLHNVADFDNELKGNFRITISAKEKEQFAIGQCVEMAATMFPNRQVPVLNGFQLDRKYFYDALSSTGYANSEVFVIDCPINENKGFISFLNLYRQKIINYIEKVLPQKQAGVAVAILVGEKSHIPLQITDNYRNSGLAHFLSVSGLHLGSIAALVFFVLRFLIALFPYVALRVDSKKISAIIAIIFSALYLLMSGMAIPAQRAFIMTAVVLIGVIFNRQAISLRMVSFAALVILVIEPQTLISVSFQMSFAAVYALVSFYETYTEKLSDFAPKHNFLLKILWYLCTIVLADFVASLATLPFALYHFHKIAVYTSLGNLLAGPLIGFWLLPAVLLCLATLPFGFAFYPLKVLGYGIEVLNKITDYVAHLPYSVCYNDNLSFWGLILIICGAYWLCIWQQPWRRWGILPIILGVITIFLPLKSPDMVFSDNLSEIAIKNKEGDMLWLPYKNNNWIQEIWRENLQLEDMSQDEQKRFKSALNQENKESFADNYLRCNKESCTYRNKIEFVKEKSLQINGKRIDFENGGYIYLDDAKVKHFTKKTNCRIWQKCYKTK